MRIPSIVFACTACGLLGWVSPWFVTELNYWLIIAPTSIFISFLTVHLLPNGLIIGGKHGK